MTVRDEKMFRVYYKLQSRDGQLSEQKQKEFYDSDYTDDEIRVRIKLLWPDAIIERIERLTR